MRVAVGLVLDDDFLAAHARVHFARVHGDDESVVGVLVTARSCQSEEKKWSVDWDLARSPLKRLELTCIAILRIEGSFATSDPVTDAREEV